MKTLWPTVKLGEVLRRSEQMIEPITDAEYREITVRLWGKGVIERGRVIGAELSGRRFIAHARQFIVSRIDARNGAMGIVPDFLEGALVTNDFPLFNVNTVRLDLAFLAWLSKTEAFVELCRRASEGTTNRVRLKEERFSALKIPLPPLPEQRRIVARIEQLAAEIGIAHSLRLECIAETRALFKSGLRQVLERAIPTGTLGDVLVSPPRNGWSASCDNAEDGTPVLSLAAVTGFHYRSTQFKRTSLSTVENAHFWLRPGDLLITRSNTPELVGHAAIYDGNPTPCIYPDLMMRLELNNNVHSSFAWYWLQSPLVREFITKNAKGTSPTMKKISQGTVMAIPFPSSLSLDIQCEIAEKLDALQAEVLALEHLQGETATELDALLPSVLNQAFNGEL